VRELQAAEEAENGRFFADAAETGPKAAPGPERCSAAEAPGLARIEKRGLSFRSFRSFRCSVGEEGFLSFRLSFRSFRWQRSDRGGSAGRQAGRLMARSLVAHAERAERAERAEPRKNRSAEASDQPRAGRAQIRRTCSRLH